MSYSNKKPLILITNDDGIHSPGLRAAAEAAACFGDLIICAPHCQQTGMGRSFPREADTGIVEKIENYWDRGRSCDKGENAVYAVHGSPALSVAHGVMELAERKPDLCISGINYGENLGQVLTCSGTVGAALEAASYGIAAIAVSMAADLAIQQSEEFVEIDWQAAQWILKKMIQKVLYRGMPDQVELWNINVPGENAIRESGLMENIAEWEKGTQAKMNRPYQFTTQSRQNYFCFQQVKKRDLNSPYRLPTKLEVDKETLEKESDIYAVYVEKKISITPITIDMTAKRLSERELLLY